MKKTPLNFRGFTLIELLVVISIIGMLSSVILVSLNNARAKGKFAAAESFNSHTYHAYGADAFAMWDFDSGVGDGTDSSGNSNTLTPNTTWSSIMSNQTYNSRGFTLNLTGTQYAVSSKTLPTTNTSVTMGAWVKVPVGSGSGARSVISFDFSGTYFGMCLNNGLMDYNLVGSVGSLGQSTCASANTGVTQIIDGQWHYIAMSLDTAYLTYYVDGRMDKKTLVSASSIPTLAWTVYVGSRSGTTQNFVGNIDEAHIYARTLSAGEVESIYAEGMKTHQFASAQK